MDDNITIDEYHWIRLGYSTIDQEYFVWDRLQHNWWWYKKLPQARKQFNIMKGQMK